MNFKQKRKLTTEKRTPPPIARFKTTDFRDSTEFRVFLALGPLPADYGKRAGEIETDQMLISFDLAMLGIESGTVEYKNLMRRMLELRP